MAASAINVRPTVALRRPLPAFTLIEVLVVVAIIALLVAVLLPSLQRARSQVKTVACSAQIKQLMSAALMYTSDSKGRLPGAGRNDSDFVSAYESGTRTDWLTWSGSWNVLISYEKREATGFWPLMPKNGRLWRYYKDEKMLKCPASARFNGKMSYSTPENVVLAMRDPTGERIGLPPKMEIVKHPSLAIQFLDEDEEWGLSRYSVDDGFGEGDMFSDRHLGRSTLAFFDGHSEALTFPRGPGQKIPRPAVRYPETRSRNPVEAWMIQIAPFNCDSTPRLWRWNGDYQSLPKFKRDANFPYNPCGRAIGCQ